MSKILVIDDDKDLLEVTHALLTKKGFEVKINNNWEEALESIPAFNPQLIILDVFLNGVDGLDICKQLKSMPHTKHIPVLIFSAYPRVAETVIYEYGADDFIAKPFEVNELVLKVHSVLSHQAYLA
jgi:two-component system phosphate regulon response regulator PhoB/two-component system alkaline phosphatase synthesis response regulator PhoP